MTKKTIIEEAILDLDALKNLAREQAKEELLRQYESTIRESVEKFFESSSTKSSEEEEEEPEVITDEKMEIDEATTSADIAGFTLPLGMSPNPPGEKKKKKDSYYNVQENLLGFLSKFEKGHTDSKFAEMIEESVVGARKFATAPREQKVKKEFISALDKEISKAEAKYAYLKESYSGKNQPMLERKLENAFSLLTTIKESSMSLRKILAEEKGEVVMKLKGLPEDFDASAVQIELVVDDDGQAEQDPNAAAATPPADGSQENSGGDLGDLSLDLDGAGDEAPTQESLNKNGKAITEMTDVNDLDENTVFEIDEAELAEALASLEEGDDEVMESDGPEAMMEPASESEDMTIEAMLNGLDEAEEIEESEETEDVNEADGPWAKPAKAQAWEEAKPGKAGSIKETDGPWAKPAKETKNGLDEAEMSEEEECVKEEEAIEEAKKVVRKFEQKIKEAKSVKEKTFAKTLHTKATERLKALVESKKATAVKNSPTRTVSVSKQLETEKLKNAKLIEGTKLMHASKGLSTKSRGDICDRLDEAKSVREVELIAKSLMEAVKRHLSSAKPKGTTALAESVNRATATKTSLKPSKKEVEAIVEGVDLARWNQLAGIVND